MLSIKLHQSALNPRLRWAVDMQLEPGVCHRLLAPNGAGKTTFLEELKIHWHKFVSHLQLGFADQAPLAPWQDLTVEAVMDILWDVTSKRRLPGDWRQLPWWQASDVQAWWKKNLSQLSGGENQWVKILMMRSLVSDAWIVDEPFQSLDVYRQKELWVILQDWLSEGKYLILVHHGDVALTPVVSWGLAAHVDGHRWERRP